MDDVVLSFKKMDSKSAKSYLLPMFIQLLLSMCSLAKKKPFDKMVQ